MSRIQTTLKGIRCTPLRQALTELLRGKDGDLVKIEVLCHNQASVEVVGFTRVFTVYYEPSVSLVYLCTSAAPFRAPYRWYFNPNPTRLDAILEFEIWLTRGGITGN